MTLRIKKFNFTSSEKIFIILWTFYSVFYYIFNVSEIWYTFNVGGIFSYISNLTIFLLLIAIIFFEQYSLKTVFLYLLVLFSAVLVEFSISDRSFLIYILFLFFAQKIDINKLIRYDMYLKIILFCFILGLCVIGVTNNYTAIINGTYKQALGFSHPNTTTCFVLTILTEYLCIHFKKMRWYEWLAVAIIWYAVMEICGGRSSGYTFIVILLLYALASAYEKLFYTRLSKIIFVAITPLIAFLSFLFVNLYQQGNKFAIELNSFFTGRIAGASRILNMYNIQLFGQEIPFVTTRNAQRTGRQTLILDNAYIRCAVYWGAILFVIIIALYVFLFWKLLENKRVDLALLSLFFVILGFGENYMLNVFYNLSFLCLLNVKGIKDKKDGQIANTSQ